MDSAVFESFLDELEKISASNQSRTVPKSRQGRRPISVENLLKKDKAGELAKSAGIAELLKTPIPGTKDWFVRTGKQGLQGALKTTGRPGAARAAGSVTRGGVTSIGGDELKRLGFGDLSKTGGVLTGTYKSAEAVEEHKLHGHMTFQGIPIAIENRKGSTREGVDPDGKPWKTTFDLPYGYIKKTEGKDGEEIDAYIGPTHDAPNAFVVHQRKIDGTGHDEDKVFLGMPSVAATRKAYLKHYNKVGPKLLGEITTISIDELKKRLEEKRKHTKLAEDSTVKERVNAGLGAGAAALAIPGLARTGAERALGSSVLYHGTSTHAAPSIRSSGLDPAHGGTGASHWSEVADDYSAAAKGRVHLSNSKIKANMYARLHGALAAGEKPTVDSVSKAVGKGKGEVLPVGIPYETLKKNFEVDPDTAGHGVRSHRGVGVPAKNVGSGYFSALRKGMPAQWSTYLKNNPGRVAGGAALLAAAPAAAYAAGRLGQHALGKSTAGDGKIAAMETGGESSLGVSDPVIGGGPGRKTDKLPTAEGVKAAEVDISNTTLYGDKAVQRLPGKKGDLPDRDQAADGNKLAAPLFGGSLSVRKGDVPSRDGNSVDAGKVTKQDIGDQPTTIPAGGTQYSSATGAMSR